MRLRFFWWGSFLRGWLQWGRAGTTCADKNFSKHTLWAFHFGPLEVQWWNDPKWQRYCFTPEEAAAEDARDRAAFSAGEKHGS